MAQDAIQDYVRRPAQYTNIDGTDEMAFGGMYLFSAVWASLGSPGVPLICLVFACVALLGYLATRTIKRRITWRRTGYVAYQTQKNRVVAFFTAMAGAAAGAYLLVRLGKGPEHFNFTRFAVVAIHVVVYAIFAIRFRRENPWKWYVLLFIAAGLAAIAAAVPGGPVQLWPPCAWFLAFTWLASAGITLYLYIRRTHPPAPEAE